MIEPDAVFAFGPFQLDCRRRVLLRDGDLLALPPRQLDILVALVEQHGQLVEKDALMRRVWGNTVVEEGNLPVNMHALRKALAGDDAAPEPGEGERDDRERYIQTVTRRGYRFVAPVRRVPGGEPDLLPATPAAPVVRSDPAAAAGRTPPASRAASSDLTTSPLASLAARPWWRQVPVALAAMAVTGMVVAAVWMRPRPGPAAPPTVAALAVLPFSATRGGASDEALGWGIADGVSSQLARQRDVLVRPGVAMLKYPGGKTDPLEAGRALQADAVVQGTVRDEGRGVRVWAQLIRVADGSRLWGLPEEGRSFDTIDQARLDLAGALAAAIGARGVVDESEPVPARLNPVAEELLLKGRHQCSHASPARSASGLVQLEQAAALEPSRAAVHAAIASCLVAPIARSPNGERMPRARDAALRALQLDERQPIAHAALALSGIYSDWDWRGARTHFERAIEQSPQDVHTHLWSAMAHTATAQHDRALEALSTARRIDPSSSRVHIAHGYALYMARRFDRAVDVLLKAPLDLGPGNQQVLWGVGLAHVQRGDRAQAVEALTMALKRTGHHPAAKAYLAYAHARFGETEAARSMLREIGDSPDAPPALLAPAHACLGERDRAFALLEAAIARRDYRVVYLGVDPMFDCLRSDARLAQMLRRLGLQG